MADLKTLPRQTRVSVKILILNLFNIIRPWLLKGESIQEYFCPRGKFSVGPLEPKGWGLEGQLYA